MFLYGSAVNHAVTRKILSRYPSVSSTVPDVQIVLKDSFEAPHSLFFQSLIFELGIGDINFKERAFFSKGLFSVKENTWPS